MSAGSDWDEPEWFGESEGGEAPVSTAHNWVPDVSDYPQLSMRGDDTSLAEEEGLWRRGLHLPNPLPKRSKPLPYHHFPLLYCTLAELITLL